jgi:hypothetical protein
MRAILAFHANGRFLTQPNLRERGLSGSVVRKKAVKGGQLRGSIRDAARQGPVWNGPHRVYIDASR